MEKVTLYCFFIILSILYVFGGIVGSKGSEGRILFSIILDNEIIGGPGT